MFSLANKTDSTPDTSAQQRTGVLGPASSRSEPTPSRSSSADGISVIGRDLTILGDKITIVSQNKLQVDGDVRGNVHGKQVVITEDGSVVGLVQAEKIEVHGGVRGAIRAVTVVLHASSEVDGNITHQTLGIAEGARFEGRVHRCDDTGELMPVLDPEAIATGRSSGSGDFA